MRLLVGILVLRAIVLFSTAAPRPRDAIQPVGKLQQSGNLVLDAGHGDRVVYRHVRGGQHTKEETDQRGVAVVLRGVGDLLLLQFLFLLVALSALKGFLLSGATSVSLAYISEEVLPKNKGKITGLYIAGNALGGMGGRVISSYLSTEFSWRTASASIGILCAVFAILFLIFSPRSMNFKPKRENFKSLIISNLHLLTSAKLLPFYLIGSLMLGIFVSLYNYLGFYLVKEPFNFPDYLIHYIYFMYIFGVFGSVATAKLTARFNHFKIQKTIVLLSVVALLLLYVNNFWIITLGLAIFTFNFFVVHVICNRIVSDYNLQNARSPYRYTSCSITWVPACGAPPRVSSSTFRLAMVHRRPHPPHLYPVRHRVQGCQTDAGRLEVQSLPD